MLIISDSANLVTKAAGWHLGLSTFSDSSHPDLHVAPTALLTICMQSQCWMSIIALIRLTFYDEKKKIFFLLRFSTIRFLRHCGNNEYLQSRLRSCFASSSTIYILLWTGPRGKEKDFIAWLKSLSNPNYKNRYLADVHCKTRVMNSIGLRIIKQPTFQMTGKHYPLNSSRPETAIKITKQLLHFHLIVVNIRQLLFVPCFTFTIPVWNIRHRCKVRILTNERGGGEALYFSRRHSWKTICLIIALHSRSKMAWSKCFWTTLNAENHTNLLRH